MPADVGTITLRQAIIARAREMAPLLELRLAEASAEAESARLLVLATAWENPAKLAAGGKLLLGDLARSRRNAAYTVKLAKQASQWLLEGVGGSSVYLENDIQRVAADIQAAIGQRLRVRLGHY